MLRNEEPEFLIFLIVGSEDFPEFQLKSQGKRVYRIFPLKTTKFDSCQLFQEKKYSGKTFGRGAELTLPGIFFLATVTIDGGKETELLKMITFGSLVELLKNLTVSLSVESGQKKLPELPGVWETEDFQDFLFGVFR